MQHVAQGVTKPHFIKVANLTETATAAAPANNRSSQQQQQQVDEGVRSIMALLPKR